MITKLCPICGGLWPCFVHPQPPRRDPDAARNARDEGIERVMRGEERFADKVFHVVLRLPKGWRGIGEDIRIACLAAGVPEPHHPNCWGGAIHGCVTAGLLVPTEDWQHMRIAKSHSRKSPEYTR